jgi:hypothetical protein
MLPPEEASGLWKRMLWLGPVSEVTFRVKVP